jgi:hypothetical protein
MQEQQLQKQQAQGGHEALYVNSVLANILGYTSQGCRLRTCSLVCTRWNSAASTVTAGKGVVSARASDALLQWLKRHGTGLRSLTVHRGSLHRNWQYNSLPDLHQLTRLELKNMTEQPKLLGAIGSCMKVRLLTVAGVLTWSGSCRQRVANSALGWNTPLVLVQQIADDDAWL